MDHSLSMATLLVSDAHLGLIPSEIKSTLVRHLFVCLSMQCYLS